MGGVGCRGQVGEAGFGVPRGGLGLAGLEESAVFVGDGDPDGVAFGAVDVHGDGQLFAGEDRVGDTYADLTGARV